MDGYPEEWTFDEGFDGGDKGCGELLMDLRLHFRSLQPKTAIIVRTLDEGAPIEIPAWCRMTRHILQDQAHPFYLIQTRAD